MDNTNKLLVLSIVLISFTVSYWLILELFGTWGRM